jgi:hypothetical protein
MNTLAGIFTSLEDLESTLEALKTAGFGREAVQWCDLKHRRPARSQSFLVWIRHGGVFGDTIDYSDRVSLMDGTCVGATLAGLLGLSYGSVWRIGSITAGVLGMTLGGFAGWCIDHFIRERRSRRSAAERLSQYGFLLLARCDHEADVQAAKGAFLAGRGALIGLMQMPWTEGRPNEAGHRSSAVVWTKPGSISLK